MIYILGFIQSKKLIFPYLLLGISVMGGSFFSSLDTSDAIAVLIKYLCLFTCSFFVSTSIILLIQSIVTYKLDDDSLESLRFGFKRANIGYNKSLMTAFKDYIIPVSLALIIYITGKNLILLYIPWMSVSLTILAFFSLLIICSILSIIIKSDSLVSSFQEIFIVNSGNIIQPLWIFIIFFVSSSLLFYNIALIGEFIADGVLNRVIGLIILIFFTSELLFNALLLIVNRYLKFLNEYFID